MRSRRSSTPEQVSLDWTPTVGLIAGVDEAGRGPLAGPVFAAAVILDDLQPIKGLADSKALTAAKALTTAEILAASTPADWRPLDPADTLYLDLAAGRVIIELSRVHAPQHVAAIKTLARTRYWDGLAINRVQDNFVSQWGDPDNQKPAPKLGPMPPEFARAIAPDLPFVALPDADGWARIALPVEEEERAALVLLGLGPEAEVIEPAGLRIRVRELAGKIAALAG